MTQPEVCRACGATIPHREGERRCEKCAHYSWKVIFLDVDGVLNNRGTRERVCGYIGVDRCLADKFTTWLHQYPDVKVVLSSSWRFPLPGVPLIPTLYDAGIVWISETPRGHSRGAEVEEWLENNPHISKYAILDDVDEFTPEQKPFFVRTNEDVGLTDADLTKLEEILNLR